jgi:hypothetical protein
MLAFINISHLYAFYLSRSVVYIYRTIYFIYRLFYFQVTFLLPMLQYCFYAFMEGMIRAFKLTFITWLIPDTL